MTEPEDTAAVAPPVPIDAYHGDAYHGIGGTYLVQEDGTRMPSDPITGLPLPPPEPLAAEAQAPAAAEAAPSADAKPRAKSHKNTQE